MEYQESKAFDSGAVSVAESGNTLIKLLDGLDGAFDILSFEVTATTNGVDAFVIQRQAHPLGDYASYLSGADFSTATANMLYCSTIIPGTMSAGDVAFVVVNIRKATGIKLLASANGGVASVRIRGIYARGGL